MVNNSYSPNKFINNFVENPIYFLKLYYRRYVDDIFPIIDEIGYAV